MGPGETDVRRGTPPWNRRVEPPLVALPGRFATLPLMALLMKEMSEPFSARAAGMKWSACNAVAESEPAVPPRNRGSCPAVKMNSSEILSQQPLRVDRSGRERESHQARPAAPHRPSEIGKTDRPETKRRP